MCFLVVRGPVLRSGVVVQNRLAGRSLFVVAASLSVVAVGCGATGGNGSGHVVASGIAPQAQEASYLAQAAATTAAVTTEKVALTVSTTPASGDPSVSVTSTGEIDGANKRAHVKATVSGTAGKASAHSTLEAVYDGDTVYAKSPLFEMFSADKPWVKISSPSMSGALKKFDGSLQSDPGSFVTFLEGAGGPVTTVGTEQVRGVPTRHVRVQLDVAKLVDQAAGAKRQKLADHLSSRGLSLDELAKLGPLPADAWIDDDGYVRRFSVTFDLANVRKLRTSEAGHALVNPGATSKITETVELYDFNEPVQIAIPPAAQTTTLDLAHLFGN